LWGTGDLGHLDEDGFLHVHGRRDALLVTGFGRNVEPGWIERELCALPGVARAAVVADGRPGLVAVIVPAVGGPPRPEDLASLNARLPDYARVARWIPADEDFTPRNGELDASGQPCREALRRRYATVLAATGIPTTPSRPDSPDTGAPP
jgi:acyl-CoA synthetase (AMP-forming)/AMP-acid ligase II